MPRAAKGSRKDERPIYQPWYEGEFWTLRVRGLERIERLMYRSILMQGWDLPTPGRIPNDPDILMTLADCPDQATWEKHGARLMKMFDLSEDGTYYTNERQQQELIKWRERRKGYAERGRMGGKTKQANKLEGKQNSSLATNHPSLARKDASNQGKSSEVKSSQGKEEQKHKNARTARGEIEYPDWLPRPEFDAYVEMRRKIKKPMTDNAIVLAVKKLGNLRERGHPPAEVLNQSIEHSWNGLFELRRDEANHDRKNNPSHTGTSAAVAAGVDKFLRRKNAVGNPNVPASTASGAGNSG